MNSHFAKKRLALAFFLILIAMPLISAYDYSYVIKEGDYFDLKIACYRPNSSLCDNASTSCNISILYSNLSYLVMNQPMTNLYSGHYNYTLNPNQTELGTYHVEAYCVDDPADPSVYYTSSNFNYLVTSNGLQEPHALITVFFIIVLFLIFIGLLATMFASVTRVAYKEFYLVDVIVAIGTYLILVFYNYLSTIYFPNPLIAKLIMILMKVGVWTHIVLPLVAFLIILVLDWNKYQIDKINSNGYDLAHINDNISFRKRTD